MEIFLCLWSDLFLQGLLWVWVALWPCHTSKTGRPESAVGTVTYSPRPPGLSNYRVLPLDLLLLLLNITGFPPRLLLLNIIFTLLLLSNNYYCTGYCQCQIIVTRYLKIQHFELFWVWAHASLWLAILMAVFQSVDAHTMLILSKLVIQPL